MKFADLQSPLHRMGGVLLAACVVGVLVLIRRARARRRENRLISEVRKRRQESFQLAEEAVLKYKQSHRTDSVSILKLSLSELTEHLQEGSLFPEDVLHAYMDQTIDLQKKLNCCTEVILDSFEQLKTIDSCKKGILYGVPVSLKENVGLKNCDSCMGVVKFINKPAEDDAVLVKVLRRQGAIPFVRTNFPQALLNFDCSNPIYGQSLNPCNLNKTPGGSSGGEGSLIGGGGSVIGIGSDIGGSCRIPASFCGICGLKPTSGRLSSTGMKTIYRGQKAVLSSPGPMARDVDSLALFMKAVLCDDLFFLDPIVPPVPFNDEVYRSRKPLRIGYYEQIEEVPITPSMIRGVQEVKVLLEKAGHTLVPFNLVKHEMSVMIMKGVFADGCATFLQQLKGTTIDPVLKPQVQPYQIPVWLKKMMGFILKPVWPFASEILLNLCGVGSVPGLWKLHAQIEDCVQDTIAEWRRLKLDVLLCPVISPAFNFNYCGHLSSMFPYTMTYNLLNFCAGVVPVSTVTAQDEENLCHLVKGNMFERKLNKAATGGVGLPVAVQCVALPWQDELCLRIMKEVEELVSRELLKSN